MMKNIFLEIEYDGSEYFGWQIQKERLKNPDIKLKGHKEKVKTIQGELESSLEKLFRKKIRVVYAGRTDRGVHAKGQCVNFKIDTAIPLKKIKIALNALLPENIRIKKIKFVPLSFHARFSAKSKVYRYVILNKKDPSVFLYKYAWYLPQRVEIERMKEIASYLKGERDFFFFAKGALRYKSCCRKMINVSVRKRQSLIYIDMEATGFLRNMARNIVMFLVKIGEGKINLKEAKKIIDRKIAYIPNPAPAKGLYLWKVKYEEEKN